MPAVKPGTLTAKEAMFVAAYLAEGQETRGNAARSAIAAGYSARSAHKTSSDMLKRPSIAAAIAAARVRVLERAEIKAADVIAEVRRLAMFDPADLLDVKSPEELAALPEEVRRAVVGWKWDREGRFVMQLAKQGALDMLCRHFGVYNDKLDVNVTSNADRLQRAQERRKAKE
jgi:phage terminase small subunit